MSGVGTSMGMIDGILSSAQCVFVPAADSEAVQKLRVALGTQRSALLVRVAPDAGTRESYCYQNVKNKVDRESGRMQLGWAIWQHSHLFIEAEPHAIFDPANGESWLDPTPNSFPDGKPCEEILFIPQDGGSYDFESTVITDNVRVPLVRDPTVLEALKLSSEKIALLNQVPREWVSGDLIFHYPPALWLEIQQMGARIGMLLATASSQSRPARPLPKIGRNNSCPCGSAKKYKRCCGK